MRATLLRKAQAAPVQGAHGLDTSGCTIDAQLPSSHVPDTRTPHTSCPSMTRLRPPCSADRIAAASPTASVVEAGRLRNATKLTGQSAESGASAITGRFLDAERLRRAMTRISPMPVSAEKDSASSRPPVARPSTIARSYRDSSRLRLAAQAFQCSRLSGITMASMQPGLTLASARSRKFDANWRRGTNAPRVCGINADPSVERANTLVISSCRAAWGVSIRQFRTGGLNRAAETGTTTSGGSESRPLDQGHRAPALAYLGPVSDLRRLRK